MEASTKKKVILFTSVSVVLGVGGYFGYQYLKDKGLLTKGSSDSENDETPSVNLPTPPKDTSATDAQIKLAKAYRVWANSSDALSSKYGKNSQFDLDAVSSNPYNKYFLNSYKSGKNDYLKALQTGAVAAVKNTLAKAQTKQTFPNDWYVLRKDDLRSYFDGITTSFHERKIMDILKQLKTNKDWGKLWSVFSKFEGWDLRKWLDYELSNSQRSEINSNWASKGMSLSDGTPQRLLVK